MPSAIVRGYVDAPSGQIHFRDVGSGPVLVFLHQTATSGRVFTPVLERLAGQFRCLALDTPGFGRSTPPPTPYRMPEYARSALIALTNLGVERFHLLGHHTGASIAAEMAVTAPERIERLILHSCPVGTDEYRAQKLAEAVPVPIARDGSHVEWVRNRVLGYGESLDPEELNALIVEYLQALPRSYEAHIAVWTQRVEDLAPRLAMPVLLLTGERDQFVAQQDALALRFPNAQSVILTDRGRLCFLQDPDQYARVVTRFLTT
ncbi:MAG: alpha/beta hydrolase [Dehalococcoidia bacterium]|nr:alpha/beta hydrolase [Dehalococcoidia bacterium]